MKSIINFTLVFIYCILASNINAQVNIFNNKSIISSFKTTKNNSDNLNITYPTITTFPYVESFESNNFPPSGWQNIQISGIGLFNKATSGTNPTCSPIDSNAMVRFNSYSFSSGTSAALISPAFILPTSDFRVRFWMYRDNGFLTANENIQIWINSNPDFIGADSLGCVYRSVNLIPIVTSGNGWYEYLFNFPANSAGSTKYLLIKAVSKYGNNIYLDKVTIDEIPQGEPDIASLISPINGSINTDIHSNLKWMPSNNGGIPNSYLVYLDTIDPPATLLIDSNITTYQPDLIQYGKTYFWKVIPYNTHGQAHNCPVWSFTTMNDPTLIPPFLEDFSNTFPPNNWTRFSGLLTNSSVLTTGWIQDDFGNITSPVNKSAKLNIYTSSLNHWLISPPINILSGINYQLEFDLANTIFNGTNPSTFDSDDKFAVVISTDNGQTWSSRNILKMWTDSTPAISNIRQHVIISLINYVGTIKIALYGESTHQNSDNDLFVDNFEIREIPVGTPNPTIVLFPQDSSINLASFVNLHWEPNITAVLPTSYKVYFDTVNPPTRLIQDSTITNCRLSGLNYNKTYYWNVVTYNNGYMAQNCPVWSFTTMTNPSIVNFPYNQGFNDSIFPPTNWHNIQISGFGLFEHSSGTYNLPPYESTGMLFFNSYNYLAGVSAALISPPLVLPSSDYRVKFWMYRYDGGYLKNDRIEVWFNDVLSLDGADSLGSISRGRYFNPIEAGPEGWYQYAFDFPSNSAGSDKYLIFKAVSEYGSDMYLDFITIEQIPHTVPGNANISYPTNNQTNVLVSSVLRWNSTFTGGNPSGYKVYFGTTQTPPQIADIDSTNFSVPLNYNTHYYWKIIPYNSYGDAANCLLWSFTTQTDPTIVNFPYFQNFDSVICPDLPIGWSKILNTIAPNARIETDLNENPYSLPNHIKIYNSVDSCSDLFLISPPIQSMNNKRIRFYAKSLFGNVSDNIFKTSDLIIGTLSNPSDVNTFTPIDTIKLTNDYQYYVVPFYTNSGTDNFIAFKHGNNCLFSRILFDNFVMEIIPLGIPDTAVVISPANTENNVSVSPEFSWKVSVNGGMPTAYKVYFGTDNPPLTQIYDGTNTHFKITNPLNISKTYYWQVIPYNNDGIAQNSPVWSFNTYRDTIYYPYIQTFNNFYLPSTWKLYQGLLTNSSVLYSGGSWIKKNFCNSSIINNGSVALNIFGTNCKSWLVSPSIIMPANGWSKLEFDLALTHWNATNSDSLGIDDKFAVIISTDNGASWSDLNVLRLWTDTSLISNTGQHVVIDLSHYNSTVVKIGFYGESTVSNKDNDIFVDNIQLSRIIPSNSNDIISFVLSQQSQTALIDTNAHTVITKVFEDTQLNALSPQISISDYATINPASGTTQNFTFPVNYNVRAQSGISQLWTASVSLAIGIKELTKNIVENIYPNPSNGKLNIQIGNVVGNIDVTIYTVLGKVVVTDKLSDASNKTYSYDVSTMAKGMYYLKIQNKEKVIIHKLMN